MRSTFIGFYSTPLDNLNQIWLADSTLFVFDTNCLLNLYRCEDHTREEIINVMRELQERVWIPFQVAFEYQRNRRQVIEESIASLSKIQRELENIYTSDILSSGKIKENLYNSLNTEISSLQNSLKEIIDAYINEKIKPRIESKKEISKHDSIRDNIDSIFNKKVGALPTQHKINIINEEGTKRYKNKQPPGFKDEAKKQSSFFANVQFENKYGDLYIWKEIIERAQSEEIKNVIFVCDDTKDDWWYTYSGKKHGALESLKTEICMESKIDNFSLISQVSFLHHAKNFMTNVNISESSLKEVEDLNKNNNTKTNTLATSNSTNDDIFPIIENEKNTPSHIDLDFILRQVKPRLDTYHQELLDKSFKIMFKANEMLGDISVTRNEIIEIIGFESFDENYRRFIKNCNKIEFCNSRLGSITNENNEVDPNTYKERSFYFKYLPEAIKNLSADISYFAPLLKMTSRS